MHTRGRFLSTPQNINIRCPGPTTGDLIPSRVVSLTGMFGPCYGDSLVEEKSRYRCEQTVYLGLPGNVTGNPYRPTKRVQAVIGGRLHRGSQLRGGTSKEGRPQRTGGVTEDPTASYLSADNCILQDWGRIGIAMVSSDFRFVCLLEVTVLY